MNIYLGILKQPAVTVRSSGRSSHALTSAMETTKHLAKARNKPRTRAKQLDHRKTHKNYGIDCRQLARTHPSIKPTPTPAPRALGHCVQSTLRVYNVFVHRPNYIQFDQHFMHVVRILLFPIS